MYRRKTSACPSLLVATFNHLFWYTPRTGAYRVVHGGEGKYYGIAAADAQQRHLLAMSRPDQERDDVLLEIEQASGKVLTRFQLASRDTHQVLRDGDRLFVTDAFRGRILVYRLPEVQLVRVYDGFTHENHVNSVRPLDGNLLALCHNFGKSWMAKIDPGSGKVVDRYEDVGFCAHDILPWQDCFIMCDSLNGQLIRVDRGTRRACPLWSEPGQWTKGLMVENDIAYFGASPPSERESRYTVCCNVIAFDLVKEKELWRQPMKYPGLINAITTSTALERERLGAPKPKAAIAA
jgi:hypothetical protein